MARNQAGRATAVTLVALVLTLSGCGGDRSGGPTGRPDEVVGQAADRTLAAGTAQVKIASPQGDAAGIVDFQARSGRLTVHEPRQRQAVSVLIAAGAGYLNRGSGWQGLPAVVPDSLLGGDPFANLDLLRGAVHILSDGGAEIDGASTIRYTLTIDPERALAATPPDRRSDVRRILQGRRTGFTMDVWVDSLGRARRVQVPTDIQATTPVTRVDRLPVATDVDYVAFGVTVGDISVPAGAR
jgi:hypothetical protein